MKKSLILLDTSACTPEHMLALQTVHQHVDQLCVGLYVPPSKSIKQQLSLLDQYIWLNSNKYIDELIPYCTETDLHNIMNFYPIQELWVGKHYSTTSFTGKDICESRGVDIKYFDQYISFIYHTIVR